MKNLVLKKYPKKGEVACEKNNYDIGLYFFSEFTQHDEEIASTNNKEYYTIEDTSIESFEYEIMKLISQRQHIFINGNVYHKLKSNIKKIFQYEMKKKVKGNPVPSLDRIQLGNEYPTDSTMKLDDKEYLIESDAWNIIALLKENRLNLLLDYIYENFDKDLVQNGVETNKEQPKEFDYNFIKKVIDENNKANNIETSDNRIILSLDGIDKNHSNYDLIIDKSGRVFITGNIVG